MMVYEIDNLRFTMQDLTCEYDGDYQLNVQRDGVDQPPHIVRIQRFVDNWVILFDPIGKLSIGDIAEQKWGISKIDANIPAWCLFMFVLPWASWVYRHWELYQETKA